jgi:hypothetical protein
MTMIAVTKYQEQTAIVAIMMFGLLLLIEQRGVLDSRH